MARIQFNDQYDNASWPAEVTANNTLNGVTNAATFDTIDCDAPTINLKITELGNNKTIKFKLQESSDGTTWADVADGLKTDLKVATLYNENGVHSFFYAGELRYVRLVVISSTASPAAKVSVLYQKHRLFYNPNNKGI